MTKQEPDDISPLAERVLFLMGLAEGVTPFTPKLAARLGVAEADVTLALHECAAGGYVTGPVAS